VRRRRLAVALAVAALVASSCGGGKKAAIKPTTSTEAPTTSTTEKPGPPALLTGIPIADADLFDRPALVVKIENAPEARPQAGIDKADVVFEEVVEGGVVRFLCVYQSQDAGDLGPVRSLRPVDPDIVSAIGGLFAYAGGAPQFEKLIKKAPVRLVGINQLEKAYVRRKDRKAPHNLYATSEDLYKGAKSSDKPPPQLFHYGEPGGVGLSHMTVVMGGLTTADWDWDPAQSRFKRTTNGTAHVLENGAQLAFANVIVQYVRYSNTTSVDPAGFPVPTAAVIGKGRALVLSGGKRIDAAWSKAAPLDVTEFTDPAGGPITLTPGPTWIMLAPIGAATTTR
jgi:hypothetical protein